jgi:hypothetical protein
MNGIPCVVVALVPTSNGPGENRHAAQKSFGLIDQAVGFAATAGSRGSAKPGAAGNTFAARRATSAATNR